MSFFKEHLLDILVLIVIIPLCIMPMGLSPVWNGQKPYYREQYEAMADALISGHIYLDMEVSQEMLSLDNPYDISARIEAGASTENLGMDDNWDHAYYNGKYYMYFGVVPAIMLFVPYKLISGQSLKAYHATQFYTAMIILGFFAVFSFMDKNVFRKTPKIVSMMMKVALVLVSVWYFIGTPALYCTAQSAAVCFSVWCLYFYIRAVYDQSFSYNKKIYFAVLGGLCGALVFGCRPSIGFVSLVAIPMFIVFLKGNNIDFKKGLKLTSVFLPYIVVGILLMIYNYLRFEDIFEFGQAYQITIADQHEYSLFSNISYSKLVREFNKMFFAWNGLDYSFPYLKFGGIFIEFPMLIIGLGLLLSAKVRETLKNMHMMGMVIFLIVTVLIIAFADIIMSPFVIERYHGDVLFVLAMLLYIVTGALYEACDKTRIWSVFFVVASVISIVSVILLFFVPNDSNFTAYYPDVLSGLRDVFPKFN